MKTNQPYLTTDGAAAASTRLIGQLEDSTASGFHVEDIHQYIQRRLRLIQNNIRNTCAKERHFQGI
jgi:hypothetical protein